MDEKELFAAWKGDDDAERKVFAEHQGEYEKLSHKKSKDIFSKIRQNIIAEGILSAIVAIGFPLFFLKDPVFFWIVVVLVVVSTAVGIKVYGQYLGDMRKLNESSILDSLEKKLHILSRYVKQLYVYLYVFAPIGFAVGFAFSFTEEEFELKRFLFVSLFSLPFLAVFIWLGRKYIHALYGKHLKSVEQLYNDLLQKD